MPTAWYSPSRPQSVGEVLDSGFRIFRATVLRCLPYSILVMITGQLPNVHRVLAGRPLGRGLNDPDWWTWYAIGLLLSTFVSGCLVLRQASLAAGSPTSTADELRTVLRRFPQLVAVLLLHILAAGIGALFLVLPGMYLLIALIFATPTVLLRTSNPIKALFYSAGLVRGNWWRTFAIMGMLLVVMIVFYILIGTITAAAVSIGGVVDVAVASAVFATAAVATGAFSLPLWWAIVLSAYGELQVRREGLDLERRAARAAET